MYVHLPVRKFKSPLRGTPFMRTVIYLLAALLVFGLFLAMLRATSAGPGPGNHELASSSRPELEYLKAVNSVAPA